MKIMFSYLLYKIILPNFQCKSQVSSFFQVRTALIMISTKEKKSFCSTRVADLFLVKIDLSTLFIIQSHLIYITDKYK